MDTQFVNDENFKRFVSIVRVCDRPQWRAFHPTSKFGFYLNNFIGLAKNTNTMLAKNHDKELIVSFNGMMSAAVLAEPSLSQIYTTEVPTWFVGIMLDKKRFGMIINIALAMAQCEDTLITPLEATMQFGGGESTWRAKATKGQMPGAVLKGKQWLLPTQILELTWWQDTHRPIKPENPIIGGYES